MSSYKIVHHLIVSSQENEEIANNSLIQVWPRGFSDLKFEGLMGSRATVRLTSPAAYSVLLAS